MIFSQDWNKQWVDKLIIGRWFHEKVNWYAEKCHDLSQVRLLESTIYYRKIGSETEEIRSLNLSIQLILIHLLAVSHRFEKLHSSSQMCRNTFRMIYMLLDDIYQNLVQTYYMGGWFARGIRNVYHHHQIQPTPFLSLGIVWNKNEVMC